MFPADEGKRTAAGEEEEERKDPRRGKSSLVPIWGFSSGEIRGRRRANNESGREEEEGWDGVIFTHD